MKTTVELPDHLLATLHTLAARERTTFRALLVSAVQQFLGSRGTRGRGRFRLRDGAVDGRGLSSAFADAGWSAVAEAIYGPGRGGRRGR
jgi:hypothetical protein